MGVDDINNPCVLCGTIGGHSTDCPHRDIKVAYQGTDASKCTACGCSDGAHAFWCPYAKGSSMVEIWPGASARKGDADALKLMCSHPYERLTAVKLFVYKLKAATKTRRHPMRKEQVCQLIDQTLMEFMEELVKGEGT